MQPPASTPPEELLDLSADELLRLAMSVCQARFGAVWLTGRRVIASAPALPLEVELSLASRAASEEGALVVFAEDDLRLRWPGIRFYAGVRLFDSDGVLRGTLALVGDRAHTLTEMQRDLLMRIAAQIARDGEFREPAERTVGPQAPLRILVVEDEKAVALGLRWGLEAEGNDVHVIGRGADVLPALATFRPDVMVLDLSLPDEDGRAVYERVLATASLPVVFSSGQAVEADVDGLIDPRRTAFLMKPYSVDELLSVIHRLTRNSDG